MIERTRKDVMKNFIGRENYAIVTSRMTKGETFKHAQITDKIVEVICMSPKTSNNGFVFPLYIYLEPTLKKKMSSYIIGFLSLFYFYIIIICIYYYLFFLEVIQMWPYTNNIKILGLYSLLMIHYFFKLEKL